MQFRRRSRAEIAINMAPLIDVIFLLVIFFAVSTTFLESAGLDLELPESSSTAERKTEDLTVTLSSNGTLFLDGSEVAEAELTDRLRAALAERERKVVVLSGDTHSEYGRVVEIMDRIRAAGAESLTIAAQTAPER